MESKIKEAALLINLGSPDAPNKEKVKIYLDEFLMDPYVIDLPIYIRYPLVKGIILNTRPAKSAEAYEEVWTEEGSPLIVYSKKALEKVKKRTDVPSYLAMRYGNPSIKDVLTKIKKDLPDLERLLVIPLYPQYAMSTTKTVLEKVKEDSIALNITFNIESLPPFYNEPQYIKNLTDSVKEYLNDPYDHLIYSFHGLPERHLRKTDPTKIHCMKVKNCCEVSSPAHDACYAHQCKAVAKTINRELNIPIEKTTVAFQSRLGLDPWLKPSTQSIILKCAKENMKRILVACPAFVSDCLETLEEIQIGLEEEFIEAGGEELKLIPCLNDRDDWCGTVANWIDAYKNSKLDVTPLI